MARTVKSAAVAVQKWQQGFSQAGPAYQAGIAAVNSSPMAAAAAQASKAVANFSAVVNNGSWAASLNAVPLSAWKAACQQGVAKFSMGAQKGLPKMQAYAQKFQPIWQQASDAAANATGSIGKFTAAMNVMVAAGRKGMSQGGR